MSNPADFIEFGITVLNPNASATVEDGHVNMSMIFQDLSTHFVLIQMHQIRIPMGSKCESCFQEFYNIGVFNEDSTLMSIYCL